MMKHLIFVILAFVLSACQSNAEPLDKILGKVRSVPFEADGRVMHVNRAGHQFWFMDDDKDRFDMLVYSVDRSTLSDIQIDCPLRAGREGCKATIEGHVLIINGRVVLDVDKIKIR